MRHFFFRVKFTKKKKRNIAGRGGALLRILTNSQQRLSQYKINAKFQLDIPIFQTLKTVALNCIVSNDNLLLKSDCMQV